MKLEFERWDYGTDHRLLVIGLAGGVKHGIEAACKRRLAEAEGPQALHDELNGPHQARACRRDRCRGSRARK